MRVSGCEISSHLFFKKTSQVILLQPICGPTLGTSGLEIKIFFLHSEVPFSWAFLCKRLIYFIENLTRPV